ncbi:MAG: hypothetical protein AAB870_01490 [Patescibacteria group bacterium]
MQHIWSVLCQKSIIDRESNLLSIIDCLEEINFTTEKNIIDSVVIPIEFQIINFWIIDNNLSSLTLKIDLLDPDKSIISNYENSFAINKGALRFRSITKIQGITATKSGRYTFRISTKDNEKNLYNIMSELPLDIKITTAKSLPIPSN